MFIPARTRKDTNFTDDWMMKKTMGPGRVEEKTKEMGLAIKIYTVGLKDVTVENIPVLLRS